jgi:hypothetical protein
VDAFEDGGRARRHHQLRPAGRALATLVAALALSSPSSTRAELVPVLHAEGLAHGFLGLRDLDGSALAEGDLVQHAKGDRVTTRLHFRFKDGSDRDETTVYTQRGRFRFVSNHVVQKGPTFKTQLESTIDDKGNVRVRYTEEGGKEQVIDERLKLPPDVANGMTIALLKNLAPGARAATVSMVAITPKPRLVKLELTPAGEDPFSVAGSARKALHYVMKVHVPGVTGVVASVLGKIPADSHFWVLGGDAPTFVKAEASLSMDGPTWRIEMVSPIWPSGSKEARKDAADSDRPAAEEKRASHPPQ